MTAPAFAVRPVGQHSLGLVAETDEQAVEILPGRPAGAPTLPGTEPR